MDLKRRNRKMDFERTALAKAAVKLVVKKAIPGILQGSLFSIPLFSLEEIGIVASGLYLVVSR